LQGLLPAVDETLRVLVSVPSRLPLEEARALFVDTRQRLTRPHSAIGCCFT